MQKKYCIIGTSAAGIAAARTLRNLDKDAHIICFSDEAESPYNKCFLADYLHNLKAEHEVLTLTREQAATLSIELRLGVRVMQIMSDNKTLMLSDGSCEQYDALLIATGTRPALPAIEGLTSYTNIFPFHALHDAQLLHGFIDAHRPARAVVIGAGLSGLEVADALCARNVDVALIEAGSQLLARHVPPLGAHVIEQMMHKHGVRVFKELSVVKVSGSDRQATAVMLSNGTVLPTDMIVYAVGLKQNNELAQELGLKMSAHGIVTNEHLQTSVDDIYAAGDIIAVRDTLSDSVLASCTWPDAMQQGMHAACAIAGKPKTYPGAAIVTTSAFFGLKLFNCGLQPGSRTDLEVIERSGEDWYHRYVIAQGTLKGFCLVGNTQCYHKLRRALLLQEPFSL